MIILAGPKHCGKSVVGAALHKLTGFTFIDLDELIEKQTGKTPREIFKCSEQDFRIAEFNALQTIMIRNDAQTIISTGGGIIDNDAAMELIINKKDMHIVYLEVSAQTAWKRILKNSKGLGSLPPFLDTENPQETHRILHKRRADRYKKIAALVVDCEDKPIALIADTIKSTFF